MSHGKAKLWSAENRDDTLTLHDLKHTSLTRFAHKPYTLTDREREYLGAHKGFRQTDRYEHIQLCETIREKLDLVDDLYDKYDDDLGQIYSLADTAFYRQFTFSDAGGAIAEKPTSPFPDLDWIEKDGTTLIDVNGPKSKKYLHDRQLEEFYYWVAGNWPLTGKSKNAVKEAARRGLSNREYNLVYMAVLNQTKGS
jgi:hypothetical protein